MKKVFFVFAVAAGLAMTACNNKPAENADAAKATADSIAAADAAKAAATPAPAATDSMAKPAMDSTTVTKTDTKTETKTEKKEEKKK